ncbi:MAG: hypothetical protein LBG76_07805 [Treponema sp.]|jgi:hypothetical protein|nr:hypothetical protein [Treponema sp.]
MKFFVLVPILLLMGVPLFADSTTELAPGAAGQLRELLNKPALIRPTEAVPLGKNWFRLETDAHVFTDEVTVAQVAAVLLDLENQSKFYNGQKSKLTVNIVSAGADESIADFVSISVGPLNIQIKTPYRASVKAVEHTDTKIAVEVRQLPQDSSSNNDIKNLFATRYAEEVVLNGRRYTYIRIYTIDEVNASILPGAKKTLENSSEPVNLEALQLIITAAKTK